MKAPASGRLEVIDFLRGVAIIEMIVTHFSAIYADVLEKIVGYTETAMALFVLLAGFMVGWHYYPRFLRNPPRESRALLLRALKVLLIQYLIIATINLPLFLLGYGDIGHGDPLWVFMLKSATFQNQIGIIHILPTFIPLFLMSPALLFLLAHGLDVLVIAISAGLFAIGHFHPFLFDLYEPTIFPVLVIQIYFVAGCLWGKRASVTRQVAPERLRVPLAISMAALVTVMVLLHGKFFPLLRVSTHPLNFYGLLYHAPIVTTILLLTFMFWDAIRRSLLYGPIALLGRHALLAFVLHLYTAKAIGVLVFLVPITRLEETLLVLSSVVFIFCVLSIYEQSGRTRPARWVLILDTLFK